MRYRALHHHPSDFLYTILSSELILAYERHHGPHAPNTQLEDREAEIQSQVRVTTES